jgi:polar amino acid transport system substrate-binding protein
MKKSVALLLTMILLLGVLAACGTTKKDNAAGDSSTKKVLTMGTSADYPPFESVDTAGSKKIIGFDIDLASAIAGKLGYKVQVKDMDFSGLIQAIKSGQVDFVMAGMTPTADRKKNVDFSDIYYTAQNMIISKKNSGINKLDDLKGKTVGVQLGSIQEGKAKDLNKTTPMNIVNRDRIPDLIEELKAGRMDAAIIEDTVAKGFLTKETELKGFTINDDPEAGSAIAFPKNSDLTAKFNKELKTMKQNGELKKLILKWFGGDVKQQ